MLGKEILSLTSVRGIAAAWVLLYHMRIELEAYLPSVWPRIRAGSLSGFLGVDLFFVLSGYVIGMHYADKLARWDLQVYARFVAKRFARIYPVYLLGIVLAAISLPIGKATGYPWLNSSEWTISGLIESLLMIQGWTYPIGRHWNVVGWSVSDEWFVYVFFPVFAFAALRVRGSRVRILAAFVVLHVVHWFVVPNPVRGMAIGLERVIVGFASGVLLFRFREGRGRRSAWWGVLGLVLLSLVAQAFWTSLRFGIEPLRWAPAYFTIVIFCLAEGRDGVMGHRALVHLGHISYSFYVIHGICLQLSRMFFQEADMLERGTAAQVAVMLGTVVVIGVGAHLSFRFIEQPMRHKVYAWLSRTDG